MKAYRATKITALAYGAWCLLTIAVASRGGEYAIGAHIWLMFTGAPAAMYTLWLPNASMSAIVVAAGVGFVQWVGLAQLLSWRHERNKVRSVGI